MRFVRALHKWIALAAALQVCLWVMSGLVMSLLDHHVVSGESTARAASAPKNVPREQALLDPQALLRRG